MLELFSDLSESTGDLEERIAGRIAMIRQGNLSVRSYTFPGGTRHRRLDQCAMLLSKLGLTRFPPAYETRSNAKEYVREWMDANPHEVSGEPLKDDTMGARSIYGTIDQMPDVVVELEDSQVIAGAAIILSKTRVALESVTTLDIGETSPKSAATFVIHTYRDVHNRVTSYFKTPGYEGQLNRVLRGTYRSVELLSSNLGLF